LKIDEEGIYDVTLRTEIIHLLLQRSSSSRGTR
jgi:hypothetical protein